MLPLTKADIKLIHSLEQKKYREREHAFVAEGPKVVGDLIAAGYGPQLLIATDEWDAPAGVRDYASVLRKVQPYDLQRASLLQHPQQVLAVFPLPTAKPAPASALTLCLDGVQDPGNLGTIIRTADWFGITDIVCSRDTADAFAPKVVQATMGSIARVNITYCDLPAYIAEQPEGTPVYGTLLDGDDINCATLTPHGLIVMGNEGNGLSQQVRHCLTHRLLIPPFPPERKTAESLNVAIATAIILARFRQP